MAARIASKSRSKIATFYLSKSPQRGSSTASGNWARQASVSAGTNTPRPPTPSVPLTKLLDQRGLTGTRLLLALATTKASTLHGCTSTSTTAATTSTTAAAASTTAAAASTTSTAATEAPTPGTTPTSNATPSASSTASSAAPAVPSTTLAPLALAVARLGADAATTSSVPTRSTAAAEATEGRRGTGEHPSKKRVRRSPREAPTAKILFSAAARRSSSRSTVSSVG
ncbi:unnamed protein product [Closterium sp. NIES-54]